MHTSHHAHPSAERSTASDPGNSDGRAARLSRRGILGAGLVAGLAACSKAAASDTASSAPPATVSAAALAKVTLNVGDQKGGSIRSLLKAAGLDRDIPYRINWSIFTSGPPILEAINAGSVDVGGVGNTPPIFAASSGADITIVAAFQQAAKSNAILVPAASKLTSPAQLKGRRIAVAQSSSAHGQTLLELKKQGLTPADVTLDFLQPADGYAAFQQGAVDAWAVWEPYISEAVITNGARVLAPGSDGSANGLAFTVAAPAALADAARNTALADYVARVAKANVWSRTHAPAWAAIYSGQTGLSEPVSLAAIRNQDQAPILLDPAVIAREQVLVDAFATAKLLPKPVAIADVTDQRFNPVVKAYA